MAADREYQRAQIPLLLGYEIIGKGGRKLSFTTDVAVGGVRFTSDQGISVGAQVNIQIAIPWRDSPIELLAEVLRSDPIPGSASFEVATKFMEVKSNLAEEITKVVHLMQSRLYLHKLLS